MLSSPKLAASHVLTAAAVILVAIPAATTAQAADSPQVVRFNGGAYDRAEAVAVDSARNVYIAGSVDTDGRGSFAVVKLSPQGSVLWTGHYSGSRGGVGGSALAVTTDSAGNVYAAGFTGDGVIFNNNIDYLVVAFGPDGTERWAQRYDGPAGGFDQASEIAVDSAGNAYVSGFSYGQNQAY